MKKKIQFLIIMVLSFVMAALLPLTAYADDTTTGKSYVSDLQVVYASSYEDAKAQLEANGYTAVEQQLDETQGVWIGYKSTTNKDEAITDIATMNMNGGYSYDEFDKMLADKKKQIKNYVSELMVTVNEYKANYEANEPAAVWAHDILNKITEDDYDNQGMGDLLLSDKAEDALNSICLESSALAIDTILTYLGIACTKDWIGDLLAEGENQEYDAEVAERAQTLYNLLPTFYEHLTKYVNSGISLTDNTTDEINKYIQDNSEGGTAILTYGAAYEVLKATPYKDGTLLDVLYKNPDDIDVNDLCPIAAAMSDGLMKVISSTGLEKAITYSGVTEEGMDTIKSFIDIDSIETTSVFAGIDRSIYEGDGVAMTSEAIRQASSSSAPSSGGFALVPKILLIISGVAMGAGLIAGGVMIATDWSHHIAIQAFAEHATWAMAEAEAANKVISIAGTVAEVLFVVAILVVVTALLLQYLVYKERGVDYTTIPRIIIEQKICNDVEGLYAYKVVKDTTGKNADLHNWKGSEWLALYYTKDANAGTALTTDMLITKNADEVAVDSYSAIHGFGTTAASDLYAYHRDGDDGLYIGFVKDTATSTATAAATSVSATWYAVSAAAGLIVGILGTIFIGKAVRKKKKAEA